MAEVINKADKKLGFDGDTFELVVRKPKDGSVWVEGELKAGKNIQTSMWKENEASEFIAGRMKSTIEAFLKSSFDSLILVGKVVKEEK